MKYISIDIETTGLSPDNCDIVEFGAIFEDTEKQKDISQLPMFHTYILPDRNKQHQYWGEPYALSMHSTIFKRIATQEKGYLYMTAGEMVANFTKWVDKLVGKERITFAGKNVGSFDIQFLKKLPGWSDIMQYHRYIDPGMLYLNPKTDKAVPSLEECLKRAKADIIVTHTALDDARCVIAVLREKFSHKN